MTRIAVALLVWLGLALLVSMHAFVHASAPVVAGTVWGLTAAALLAWWRIPAVRARIDTLPLAALVAIHLCRFVGLYFLSLGRAGKLPPEFAVPAGVGDVVVAMGAVLLLIFPALRERRAVLFGWNVIGLLDIVLVVCNALRCGLRDWASMAPLRELPLALLPTFIVPLIIVSHGLIFARLRLRSGSIMPLVCLSLVAAMNSAAAKGEPIRYAVIGDSYSNGEGATPGESWPSLLTRDLKAKGIEVELVSNPSITGWTSQQAIDRELPEFIKAKPNFGTLLIGVNDWVQGASEDKFRRNFVFLVDEMLKVLKEKNRLLIVTIPDFGVTPDGPRFGRGRDISQGLARFNEIIAEESRKRDLRVVDIFPLSKQAKNDQSLVGPDGLHPSAKQYAEWERIILPVALEMLKIAQ